MSNYISGWKTDDDWRAFRDQLIGSADPELWHKAYDEFFLPRLRLRYFNPIEVLQRELHYQGEGFSILTIQCALIEFMESTFQGYKYRFVRRHEALGPFEYNISSSMFRSFFCNRLPFSKEFTEDLAEEFYRNIRCGLLHEAQTKNGWRIWADDPNHRIVDGVSKIVFRNNLYAALVSCVEQYREDLSTNHLLQEAFIRKIDSLC